MIYIPSLIKIHALTKIFLRNIFGHDKIKKAQLSLQNKEIRLQILGVLYNTGQKFTFFMYVFFNLHQLCAHP